jgi:predicted O-methyltransferase YrrM
MDKSAQKELEARAKPLATREWGQIFYWLAIAGNMKRTCEIGIGYGYTSLCLAEAMKQTGGIHVAYDIREENIKKLERDIKAHGLEKYCLAKVEDSKYITLPTEYNFIHIDGCHKYDYVKRDVEGLLPFLSKYGTMAIHDVDLISGPRRYLNELLQDIHEGRKDFNIIWWPFAAGVAFITRRYDRPVANILEEKRLRSKRAQMKGQDL